MHLKSSIHRSTSRPPLTRETIGARTEVKKSVKQNVRRFKIQFSTLWSVGRMFAFGSKWRTSGMEKRAGAGIDAAAGVRCLNHPHRDLVRSIAVYPASPPTP